MLGEKPVDGMGGLDTCCCCGGELIDANGEGWCIIDCVIEAGGPVGKRDGEVAAEAGALSVPD